MATSASNARTGRSRAAVATTAIGALLALIGGAFVISRIASTWDETQDAIEGADGRWLVAGLAWAAIGMTAIAVPWTDVVRTLGGRLDRGLAVLVYYVGEIGKYVPGGVWPVVGRGELAVRAGVDRRTSYASVLFSLAALYLAGLLLGAALLPAVLAGGGASSRPALLVVLVPLGLIALHPAVLGRVLALAGRLARRDIDVALPSWPTMVGLVVRYVPAWLAIGTATWCVSQALGGGVSWVEICFATVLSWAAGFLVAPVPGGVGIREAAFVAAASSFAGGAIVAICARLLFMLVDAVGAIVCGARLGRRGIRREPGAVLSEAPERSGVA